MRISTGRIFIGAISIVALATSLTNLATEVWAMSGSYIATAFEKGEIGPAMSPRELARSDTAIAFAGCRPQLYRQAMTLRLAYLDSAISDPANASSAGELTEAADAIGRALRCNPYDGNLWLRAASLELVRTGNLGRSVEFLDMSRKLAPSEGWIIRARLPVARSLATSNPRAQQILRDDFIALATSKWSRDAAAFYLRSDSESRLALDGVIKETPETAMHPFRTWLRRLQDHHKS
ncbi:hypothetical protein IZ6_26550 [Terrihabitans soli]|uniref:Tetratricopeptide repeat protein n=1 Tax=Terrihabitans soli TaxID=708113 RepID=A0A6S6QXZ2_9HYPH|nr:hypothetical protein [Terrihabitans soli]BCJ91920.1 hypothetical protein IZ6_26550 [Terrihabitans soli]